MSNVADWGISLTGMGVPFLDGLHVCGCYVKSPPPLVLASGPSAVLSRSFFNAKSLTFLVVVLLLHMALA